MKKLPLGNDDWWCSTCNKVIKSGPKALNSDRRPTPEKPPCRDPLDILREYYFQDAFMPLVSYIDCLAGYRMTPGWENSPPVILRSLHDLKDAKIFDLGFSLHQFHAQAYELVRNLYNLGEVPRRDIMRDAKDMTTAEKQAKKLQDFYNTVFSLPANALPRLPEKRPFPSMFLACSGPLYTGIGAWLRVTGRDGSIDEEEQKAYLENDKLMVPVGFLVSDSVVMEYDIIMRRADLDRRDAYEGCRTLHWEPSTGWIKQQSIVPWIICLIIQYLNHHNTITKGRLDKRSQRSIQKVTKKSCGTSVRPRDYFTMLMSKVTLEESAHSVQVEIDRHYRSYRTDVRGHESCKVYRGPLPLDRKTEEKLAKRGYHIYTTTDPSLEDRDRLNHRNIPPRRPGEWMAILSWWRDSFMSPADPELPYVPAIRKPTEPLS